MAVLYCKLPVEIREEVGTFCDDGSSIDGNHICWKARDNSVLLYKPARGKCRETGDM